MSRTEDAAVRRIASANAGKPYERSMSGALATYCVKQGLDYRTVIGTNEDRFGGTDFRIYSGLDVITSNAGILRIDFTSAFSHKDNMPFLWTPQTPVEQLRGRTLRFGVRTGNKTAGFKWPVAVIGIDASLNTDPDDDIDVDLMANQIRSMADKNAPRIIAEAGEMIAAYTYLTEPAYAVWLGSAEAEDIFEPDVSRLRPNYAGAGRFNTRKPSGQTVAAIRAARSMAADDMAGYVSGTHEFERAKDFYQKTAERHPRKSPDGPRPTAADWLEHLAKARKAVREQDEKDDGLGF